MKRFNKKPLILGLWAIFCASFLFFYSSPANALSSSIRQVKASGSSAVYYLYYAGHLKKAYLNADIYLDYGNKWSDVKEVNLSELNSWPNAKLIKTAVSPAVYYISGNKKSLIASWGDMESFLLDKEPIITVSQKELDAYQTIDNYVIGLKTEPVEVPDASETPDDPAVINPPIVVPAESGNIFVYNDLVKGSNGNTILSGSNNNLMGIFRFSSPDKVATITSITFDFAGIFSENALNSASVLDANNSKYPDISVGINQSRRQATISFHTPITINPGTEKMVKIYLDLAAGNFNNQTIYVELKQASNIVSNLTPSASFPLIGTGFQILDGSNILGNIKSQEQSIAAKGGLAAGSRLIGEFIISDESDNEEADVKNLTFVNSGSASVNDWEDFRLFNNGQIIARATAINADGFISFDIPYLHLIEGSPVDLTVVASLKSAHNVNATVDLGLFSASVVGKNYGNYLTTNINNISASSVLN
jgi:hypothetical protein